MTIAGALINLALATGCILSAGGVFGWLIAEWAEERDSRAGHAPDPQPTWSAQQQWGTLGR